MAPSLQHSRAMFPFTAPARYSAACVIALYLAASSGCRSHAPAVDDISLTNSIQAQIAGDSALTGLPVDTVVTNGVATLSGQVTNDAQRTIAARDAASIPGVKEVINTISIYSQAPTVAHNTPPPAPTTAAPTTAAPAPTPKKPALTLKAQSNHQPAPIERTQPSYNLPAPPQPTPAQPTYNPPPQQPPQQPVQRAAAPPPSAPTYKTVTISSGDTLPVRITETLDSATTQPDTTFSGVVASDILADGLVAIPAGATVSGHVDAVQEAAHFKGAALLTVSLVSLTRRGEHMSIITEPYTVKGKGRGGNTAEKTGGGAAVGAILGGIFGGGKGAAIGAAAGGGVGAGSNGITRGQQVQIESESVVRFRLSAPLSVRVRTDNAAEKNSDPTLERRPSN